MAIYYETNNLAIWSPDLEATSSFQSLQITTPIQNSSIHVPNQVFLLIGVYLISSLWSGSFWKVEEPFVLMSNPWSMSQN